jgi:hypothetical protein
MFAVREFARLSTTRCRRFSALPVPRLSPLHVSEFFFNLDQSQTALLLRGVIGVAVGVAILILRVHVLQVANLLPEANQPLCDVDEVHKPYHRTLLHSPKQRRLPLAPHHSR